MAEINFEIYKTQPFYLHHNFQDFYQVFIKNESNIKEYGSRFLEASIIKQREREKYLYEALKIDQGEWQLIGKILFGIGNDCSDSKLDDFLQKFVSFIDDDVNPKLDNFVNEMKGKKITEKEQNLRKQAKSDSKLEKDLRDAANKFIEAYNEPVKKFKNWIENHNDELDENSIKILSKIFESSRSKRSKDYSEFVLPDGTINTVTNIAIDRVIDFLKSTKGFIGNIVGDIGEESTIFFMETKEKEVKNAIVETIIGTSAFGGTNTERKKLTTQNIDYYTDEKRIEQINKQIRTCNVNLETDDGKFKLWFSSSDKNTETLSKNLKADEIFKVEIKLESGEKRIENYGISSKTSYTDSGDLKIYTGSFFSAFENLFKSSPGLFDAGIIGEIINFLIYSIFNAYGSGTYGSYTSSNDKNEDYFGIEGDAIEDFDFTRTANKRYKSNLSEVTSGSRYKKFNYVRDLEGNIITSGKGKNVTNKIEELDTSFFMAKVRPLYILIIQDFAYQWFTGGTSPTTHADFFSVFNGKKHYFIPMSIILEAIQNLININDFALSQDLLPTIKGEKSPLELKNYKNTWNYTDMKKIGMDALDSGSGKTIVANKDKIFNNKIISSKLI